ncbi:hypothetical protein [uncultured Methylobacterium sp.]|uniref:hypothetical protein n=1 Tax=uncultured Methylobacterium sp. TaxID=157278 RepID=UPI0035CC6797
MSTDGKRILGLVPAILAALVLRRSGVLPAPNVPPPEDGRPSGGPGYETSDVHVGNTARAMAGLMLAALVAVGVMVWMMGTFAASQRRALPSLTPQQTTPLKPPAPNLQARPYADIDRVRAAQGGLLDGYAFTDAARRRARIPVERAMALTVGRTLDP